MPSCSERSWTPRNLANLRNDAVVEPPIERARQLEVVALNERRQAVPLITLTLIGDAVQGDCRLAPEPGISSAQATYCSSSR